MTDFWNPIKKNRPNNDPLPTLPTGQAGSPLPRGRRYQPCPLLVLAPMHEITDPPFRRMIAKYGKPDVMFTEFVSTDALCSAGKDRMLRDLEFHESECPIVAQIWGNDPDKFLRSAKIIKKLGFDGIDINMGCPEKKIQKQNACAALIKMPKLAQEIIAATKAGAGRLPVSVKTRIGYDKCEVETWIPSLIEAEPAAICLHGRTKKQMYLSSADWEAIARAKEIVLESGKDIPVIGNGDVKNLEDAYEKAEKYKVDGIMVGRAMIGNPWFFNANYKNIDLKTKFDVLIEHCHLFEKLQGDIRNFSNMKKHFKAYVSGFAHAKELRMELMNARNANEIQTIIDRFRNLNF